MSKNLTNQKVDKEIGQHDKMSKNLIDQKIEKQEKKKGTGPGLLAMFPLSFLFVLEGKNRRILGEFQGNFRGILGEFWGNFEGDFGRKFE